MYARNRRYRSSPHSLHLSSDNINSTGKHVDTPPRDIYLDLVTSSRFLEERLSRRFSDRHFNGDGSGSSGAGRRNKDTDGEGGVSERRTSNASSSESPRFCTDSYIPYGTRPRPPERGKWLAYAKNIKPRKQLEGSNLTKSRSMENIDICSKYPRLQNSNFYQSLHKKYPQAFQRRLSAEAKTRRPSRRLFNSGLHFRLQDDVYDSEDSRSVCSERPMSSLESDLSDFLNYGDHQYDRDCRTSPTPSMMSDLTVKERLNATSDRLYHLLYNGVPRGRFRNSYDPGLTPRSEVTPRALRSRTSSVSSDLHGFDDLDHLSSPRHLDPYHSKVDTSRLTMEEQIRSLQRELELKDRQLRTYKQKLQMDTQSTLNTGSKHSEDLDSSNTRVMSPDSPPDSAIDVDSSSIQSVVSMDTKYHHNTDNSSGDVKYPNGSNSLEKNGNLPNTDANYFMNDLDSFTVGDVIPEVDEELLDTDTCGSVAFNKASVDDQSDDKIKDEDLTDRDSLTPTPSSPESETEAMMEAIVQQTMSRIPSGSSVNIHSLPGNDLPHTPGNDLHSSPDNNLHITPENDLSSIPGNDLPITPENDLQSTPDNDLSHTPDNDLQSTPDDLLHTLDNNLPHTPVNDPHIKHNSSNDSPSSDLQHSSCHDSETKEPHTQTCSQVHFEEEIDDSDPRLGIPEVKTYNETLIQERYHEKRQKFKYHAKRRCMTPREKPESASIQRNKCQSDDQVSILCSPRPPNGLEISNNKLQKSNIHRSNHSLNVIPEKQELHSRRLVSESDIRNVGLENSGIFFSKSSNTGSVGSFQSDFSTDTLVASQQSLAEPDLTESYPKVTLHSHSPRKRFRFKNIFKGKKGHYNPSQVEANLPVDLETMLKQSALSHSSHNQEVNQTFYSVQYEKSKNHSLHADDGESFDHSDEETPQHIHKHQGTSDESKEDYDQTAGRHSSVNSDSSSGQAELAPPPPYSLHLENSQLTAYEAALVNLDQNGVDIDELIESDSEGVFSAKPVVIDSLQKNQNKGQIKERNEGKKDEESETRTGDGTEDTLETENDHTQEKQQSSFRKEEQDDSIDSEDEVFTHDDKETVDQNLPVFVKLSNQVEPTLGIQHDSNGEKQETGQAKVNSDSTVDNLSDTDKVDEPDRASDNGVSETDSDGDVSCRCVKVDKVSGVGGCVSVSSEMEYSTGANTRHDKQEKCDNGESNTGNQRQEDQGPEQKTQGPEPGHQAPEDGNQGPEQEISSHDSNSAQLEEPYATVIVHGDSSVRQKTLVNSDSDNSAELDLSSQTQKPESHKGKGDNQMKQCSFIAAGSQMDDSITVLDDTTPPVPKRAHQREESNLVRSKELSASKQSLSDKMRSSAKSKFKAIRKAVSLDKGLNKAGVDSSDDVTKEKNKDKKKSGFKMPKIKAALFTKKKKSKPAPMSVTAEKESVDAQTPAEKARTDQGQQHQLGQPGPYMGKVPACQFGEPLDTSQDGRGLMESSGPLGKLLKLNQDGTQVIQIHKPKHGPVGFFIARGNAEFKHGVFVSRFSEGPLEALYSGLLSVGDEILEMNKFVLRDLALDDIYDIMAAKETLVMTILPLMARNDV